LGEVFEPLPNKVAQLHGGTALAVLAKEQQRLRHSGLRLRE
jgi:hypothetical protein